MEKPSSDCKTENLGLIVISHDHDLIEKICDRCFYMESGKMRQMKE